MGAQVRSVIQDVDRDVDRDVWAGSQLGQTEGRTMVRYNCTLGLVRRLWPVVDGEHYHGEIMRFRLHAEPEADDAAAAAPNDFQLELRIGGMLLARPDWDALMVREVATHGMAYLRELIQRDGLPQHTSNTYILNEKTDGGAYLEGTPYRETAALAHRPFPVTCARSAPTASAAQGL